MAGSTSTSIVLPQRPRPRPSSSPSRCSAAKTSTAEYFAPPARIVRITGSTESGWVGQEVAELGQPLGHPGSLVQQLPRRQERPERRGHRPRERPLDPRPGRQVGVPHRLVAEELQLADVGRPTRRRCGSAGRGAASGCRGRARSAPATTSKTVARSGTVRADQADAVQRPAGRHQADGADQSAGRLEADDPVERRRHPSRTGGVGGHRERHLAGGHRERRPGTGPARDQVRRRRRCAASGTGCGCRSGRWRTGRGWSCRRRSRRPSISRWTTGAVAVAR